MRISYTIRCGQRDNMHVTDNSMIEENCISQKTIIYKPDGIIEEGISRIITEHSLQIFVNEQLVMKLVCTPTHLKELVVGRLITAGYIEGIWQSSGGYGYKGSGSRGFCFSQ